MERFLEISEEWGAKYPAIVRLWERAWAAEFVPFLRFDVEIRKIVCTTYTVDSANARIRKAVRARGRFPAEQAALKCVTSRSGQRPPASATQAQDGGSTDPRRTSRPGPRACPTHQGVR